MVASEATTTDLCNVHGPLEIRETVHDLTDGTLASIQRCFLKPNITMEKTILCWTSTEKVCVCVCVLE